MRAQDKRTHRDAVAAPRPAEGHVGAAAARLAPGGRAQPGAPDVCVIGLGYVGLPTAAVFAERGLQVLGVDVDPHVLATVGEGRVHLEEPGLAPLVRDVVGRGSLRVAAAPVPAPVSVICVPTPSRHDHPDRAADLRAVEAAITALAPVVPASGCVILESTSPPGTTRGVIAKTLEAHGKVVGRDVFVAYAPERVLPGRALHEIVHNDRVIGGVTPACAERCAQIYRDVLTGAVVTARAEEAELTKLAENAFRDVNIAYANELANVCDALGADVHQVIALANRHPRVQILRPGIGVGGHCIAIDPWFVVAAAPDRTPLLRAARAVNDGRPAATVAAVLERCRGRAHPVVACLGLAYKPDIDDVRESPAIAVVERLRAHGLALRIVEPHLTRSPWPDLPLAALEPALRAADVVVILVAHRQFAAHAHALREHPGLFDAAGLFAA